tara:strand:+ start:752 stop:1105 length:354 start_codon:yes stop_codon:yes gene_type:complete
MPYQGRQYKIGGSVENPVAYSAGDVIVDRIAVKRGDINKPVSLFVKLSAGALTSLEVYESIDGVDWRNATALAAYQGSSDWAVLKLVGGTYPTGTLLQLRCVTSGVTVTDVIVVQDW